MCGICGQLVLDGGMPADRSAVAVMSAALAHRGPDGAGMLADGQVALAVRRLAIVDTEGGDQPIASEDGRIHVVLNGEIYNFVELRRRLRRRGHRFRTRTDTEVLVHLYEERGERFVEELRGMFAIALWDASARRLVLARDRFGIKPLVYWHAGGRLTFASELKALLALPHFPREVDPDALSDYLALNTVLAPRTMLLAARRLEAGQLLVAHDGAVRIRRYARDRPVPAAQVRREPLAVLAEETRERLRDAVRVHLRGDVEVGVLLSGGVDSGTILALAADQTARPLRTFTVGFHERVFDELAPARAVARRYGTEHRELLVGPHHAEALLREVAWTFCEPRGDATALPYWLAARLAAEDVKVVLSGEGGDELFGGYQTYVADLHRLAARPAAWLAPLVERRASSSGRLSLDYRMRRLALGAGLGPVERHHAWKEILSAETLSAVLETDRWGAADPLVAYRRRYAETAGAERIARLQDLDVGTFLADDLLVQTDRAGMAHGLEIRVPFLDPVVAQLALSLPRHARVRGLQTKRVLRAAAAPLLPREVVRGPKRGFVAPAAAWLRGPLQPFVRDVLSPARLRRQGLLRPRPVQALLDRHVARREDLSRQLWALMALTLWHERVLEAPAASLSAPARLPLGRMAP